MISVIFLSRYDLIFISILLFSFFLISQNHYRFIDKTDKKENKLIRVSNERIVFFSYSEFLLSLFDFLTNIKNNVKVNKDY